MYRFAIKLMMTLLPALLPGWICYDEIHCSRHEIHLGPEVYHVARTRSGGTKQDGVLAGVRGIYDRIGRYCWYWGGEFALAQGSLRGHTGTDARLRSHFDDAMVEGRFGYTLQSCSGTCGLFTPFIGYGFAQERNRYVGPSPVHVHFKNSYDYAAVGFLSRLYYNPCLSLGLNVTVKYGLEGKIKVTHDPEGNNHHMRYENRLMCRICLPITYQPRRWGLCINPFYEYRHFGGLNQVPFNFLDTKLKIWGCDFFLTYKF